MKRAVLMLLGVILAGLACPGLAAASTGEDAFSRALARGPLYATGVALLGGLAVSLTPCVYPMIAVTVSVFGAREARSRWQATALSGAFVLGIVAMFVPLGVMAGLTGSVFGSVLQSPWVVAGISALFLVMAASLFGAFEFTLGERLTNRLALLGGIGYRGAFLLGLACGLVASPCTGPVLTGILAWIARTQSAVLGALAMGAFALGLGVPFFLVGAFAVRLPKSGRWMLHVKTTLGIVLVVVALWFLSGAFPALGRLVPPGPATAVVAGVAVLLGLALGAVHRSFEEPGVGVKVAKAAGILLASAGAFTALKSVTAPARSLAWENSSFEEARGRALAEQRPLLVDFTASWCGACQELDVKTFADARVSSEASRFIAVKVDATRDDDPAVSALMSSLQVRGLPTVVLFDSAGREVKRYTDFVGPEPMLEALRAIR